MDQESPDHYVEDTQQSIDDTRRQVCVCVCVCMCVGVCCGGVLCVCVVCVLCVYEYMCMFLWCVYVYISHFICNFIAVLWIL